MVKFQDVKYGWDFMAKLMGADLAGQSAFADFTAASAQNQQIAAYCQQSGFQSLMLKEKHIYTLTGLKREETAPPHKDPFDRILICQASTENMMFVTHDSLMLGYNEPCILVV